jgi:hypothetical protein
MSLWHRITHGIEEPVTAAIDPKSNNLFVLNGQPSVTVYPGGGITPIHAITTGLKGPGAMTVDSPARILAVANVAPGARSISEYSLRDYHLIRTIARYSPPASALASDPEGNLYTLTTLGSLSKGYRLEMYAPSGTRPIRSIKFPASGVIVSAIAKVVVDEHYVYVLENGSLYIVDRQTWKVVVSSVGGLAILVVR